MKGERGEVSVGSRPDSHQHGCEWIPHYLGFHCSQMHWATGAHGPHLIQHVFP